MTDWQQLSLSFYLRFLLASHPLSHPTTLQHTSTGTFNMVTESPAFKKAVEDSRKLKAKPDNDELLEVYNFPSPDPIIPASTQKKRESAHRSNVRS